MKRFVYRLLLSFLIAFFLAACASLPSTPNPNTPPNIPNTSPNTLEPDAVFEDESGLVLAASAESLKETIGISISSSSENPKAELAEGLSVVGEFFVIESSADLRLGSSPFGAGLPVPESANVERLKVAVWASLDEAVSLHEQEGWQLLSGVYDASRSLFLVPHYAFSEASNVYVLVEDALGQKVTVSPTASTELNTQAITPDFVFNWRLSCFDSNFQPKPFVNDIAQFLSDSYLEFLSLGFKKPAIQEEITGFDWGSLSFTYKDVFEVDLKAIFTTPNKSEPTEDCESTGSITNLGVYKPSSRLIVICIDTANGNSFSEDTVRHEYFHATQYAYSAMRNTWAKRWFSMVEGTATLAGSSPTGGLARDNRTLMPVDVPLLSFSDTKLYQYRSQDFYYFLADQFNQSDVGFLKNFLAKGAGSSEISQAIASFNDTELTNLKTAYWAWAQNQALVKSFNPNSFLGTSCKLEPAVATPSSMRFYANESVLSRESSQQVAPLSSKLIAFTFDEQIGSYTADLRIDTSGTTGLKVMFVDPDDCSSAAEQSSFSVSVPVNTSKVIYALVSNNEYGGSTQSFKAKHDIQFDGLDLSIDQPTATNFDEDDTIPLQASLNNVDSSKYLIKWSYDDNGTEIVLASTWSGERKNIKLCDGFYDISGITEAFYKNVFSRV